MLHFWVSGVWRVKPELIRKVKHVWGVKSQISWMAPVVSEHQGRFLGEGGPCATLSELALTAPPRLGVRGRWLGSSCPQPLSEHSLFSQNGIRAFREACAPAREGDS